MGSNSSVPAVYDSGAYGIMGMYIALTTIAVIARATSRYLQRASFGIDDALAYFGWFCYTGNAIVCTLAIPRGAMDLQRKMTSTPEERETIQKHWVASSVFYNLTMISVKLSMLFLYRRIFTMNARWFSIFWWLNVIIIFPCWTAVCFGIVIYSNINDIKLGDTTLEYGIPAISAVNALSDILILVLPLRSVLKLHLNKRQNLGIAALFCLGLMTTLVSLLRMSLTLYQNVHRLPWNAAYSTYVDIMLAGGESCASVLCVCLPVTRRFFIFAGEIAARAGSGVSSLISLVSRSSHDRDMPEQASGRSFRSGSSRASGLRKIHRERTYEIGSTELNDFPATKSKSHEAV